MASITQSIIRSALSQESLGSKLIAADILEAKRRKAEKQSFLADPAKLDKAVAAMAESFSPVTKRVSRPTRYTSKVEATDAAIPEGHPMKGYAQQLRDRFQTALQSNKYAKASAGEILTQLANFGLTGEAYEKGGTISRLEGSFKYKRLKDEDFFEWGEDEAYTKQPGYDMWLNSVKQAEDKELASEAWFADWDDYKAAALWGAGIGAAFGAITAGPAGAPPMAATFAAISPIYEAVAHPLRRAVMGTQWYRSKIHSGSTYETVKAKAGALGLEMGLAFGSAAGANKAFKTLLSKAVASEKLTEEAATKFFRGRTAKQAIAFGETRLVEKLHKESLEGILDSIDRSSVFDAATAAVERATAPPQLLAARSTFTSVLKGVEQQKQLAEGISKISKGLDRVDKIYKEIGTGATEMKRSLTVLKGQRTKSIKQMFKELSDEGAEDALKKSEATGDLDEAVRKAHTDETILKSVNGDEAKDYAAVLVSKKKAGRKIYLTDKARVILEKAGYTAKQIQDMSSSKIVRLARQVRGERKKNLEIQKLITTQIDEVNTAVIAEEARLQAIGTRLTAIDRKAKAKAKTKQGAKEETVEETAEKLLTKAEADAHVRAAIASGRIHALAQARRVLPETAKRGIDVPASKGVPYGDPERLLLQAQAEATSRGTAVSTVIAEEHALSAFVFEDLERQIIKKYGSLAYDYWYHSKFIPEYVPNIVKRMEAEAKRAGVAFKLPTKKKLGEIENLYKVLRRKYKVDITAAPRALQWLEAEGYTGVRLGKSAKYYEDEILQLKGMFDAKNLGKFLLAGAASVPLISLLSPKDAEASVGAVAAKTIPAIVAGAVKGSSAVKGRMKDLVKQMDANAWTAHPVSPGQKLAPRPQVQIDVAADAWDALGSLTKTIERKKKFMFGLDRIATPYGAASVLFKSGYNSAVQLGHAQAAWGNNSRNHLMIVRNILKDVPGLRNVTNKVEKEMRPLLDGYNHLVAHQTLEMKMEEVTKAIDNIYDDVAKTGGKKTLIDLEKKLTGAEARMEILKDARDKLQPAVDDFLADYEGTMQRLAKEHPSVRIALAVEDTADYKFRPWLAGSLNYNERVAVGHLKNLNEEYAIRMLEQDMAVITERPFLHHALHPKFAEKNAAEIVERLGVDVQTSIPFTHFRRRVKYSRAMMPEINYAMERYIPDAERRLQLNQFWYGGGKKSWRAFKESSTVKANPALHDYFDRLSRAYTPAETRSWNTWMNRYAATETFLLLGFAPATGFKHFFKNIGTWGTFGMRHSVSHMDEAFSISTRNYINSPEVQRGLVSSGLRKLGLPGKRRKKFFDEAASSFTHQFRMLNMFADLEHLVPTGRRGFWAGFDRLLQKANQKSSIFIRGVESFDRAHSFMASLSMAAKRGMTAKQATYGIMDTVLKNNFLGMGLNPKWMHNPTIRAMFLFQNTPFKLLERRLVTAYKAGKDIKTTFGIVRHQNIMKTLGQMRTMARDIKAGEDLLKQNLIADAITRSRDAFGTPMTKQFMREFIYAGAVIWGLGGIMDVDFMPHTFHLPFLRSGHFAGPQDPTLAVSPFAAAAYRTIHGRQDATDRGEQPEFWMTEFARNWLGKKGIIPQTAHKVMRLSNNDIPDIYRGSDLQYLFSVPAAGEH